MITPAGDDRQPRAAKKIRARAVILHRDFVVASANECGHTAANPFTP
jgi:hypothetical protein